MEYNNDHYKNITILIKIYCFQEEFHQKIKMPYKPDEKKKNFIILIQKDVMKEIKDIFNYKNIYQIFKKAKIIEHIIENNAIKYENLNEPVLSNIINSLEKYKKVLVNEIGNINIEKLNFGNKKWNYKIIQYNKKKTDQKIIKYIDDFEIINLDIFTLLEKRNIKLNQISGEYIIDEKKIFLFLIDKELNYFEIGHFDNKDNFIIEYLFNPLEISDSISLSKYFKINGINKTINNFDKNKEINLIYYDKYKYFCYKFDKTKIFVDNDKQKEQKPNNLKLKGLILLSIYQNKICKNINLEEEVFLLNKNYFENLYYSNINNMIIKNEKIQNYINKIDIQDLSLDINHEIVSELDTNELKDINKVISNIKQNINHNPKEELIILLDSKKINIYKEFILISQKLFNDCISKVFNIKLENQDISFISVNNKHILNINNNNQYIILIGKYNPQNCSYNIEQILDYESAQYLKDEFNYLIKMDIDNYYNNRLIINKNDIVSPIFSNDEIIGYLYYYDEYILDYSSSNEYIKYLKNKNVKRILSLYIFYKRIEEKTKNNNINYEECYLIDKDLLINIKNESNYKLTKEELDIINFNYNILDKNNINNIYYLIINLPNNTLKEYSNKKIDKNKFKNINIEPNIIVININIDEVIMIYNNFGIIDKKILELFIGNYKNDNLLAKYIINNGYIIINLPNYLNKKYISLIGSLDYDKNISIEYLLIFNNDNDRKNHIEIILNELNNYLNNINFINNNSPIFDNNSQNIGTIIKYDNNNNNNNNNQIIDNNSNNNNYDYDNNNYNNNIINDDYNNNYNNNFIYNNVINNNNFINNNNNNQIIDNKIYDLNNQFGECPKIGIQNVGATC